MGGTDRPLCCVPVKGVVGSGTFKGLSLRHLLIQAPIHTSPPLPLPSSSALCLKIVFERILNWLRLGVLPVLVVEGEAPAAKQPLQAQRWAAR